MTMLSNSQLTEFNQKMGALRMRHFLNAGQTGQLKTEAFVPATGIGKFDALYSPQNNRLDINIPTRFWFQEKIGKAEHESELAWTVLEKTDFVKDAVKHAASWGGRYVLRCVKPGWNHLYANVHVNLLPVGHREEYYVVKVRKLARFKSSGGINHGEVPHICGVNNHANALDESKRVDQIFNFKEGIFRAKLRESKPDRTGDYFEFGANSTTVTPEALLRLTRFATYLKQNRTDELKGIKAYVVGLTGKKDSILARNLKRDRAANVAQVLNHPSFGGSMAEVGSADEAWAKEAIALLNSRVNNPKVGFGGVLIVIRTPTGASREVAKKYVVMTHEVGHMLGLPDEYMGVHSEMTQSKMRLDAVIPATYQASTVSTGNDRLRAMQDGMTRALNQANVSAPMFMGTTGMGDSEAANYANTLKQDFYDRRSAAKKKLVKSGQDTSSAYETWKKKNPEPVAPAVLNTISSSIMHSGDEVLPAHYVTIWSALSKITAGYIEPDEWTITAI